MKAWLSNLNLRFDRNEISGSLGDMGTFLPLVAGMVNRCGMNLGHILFFAGAMNLVTGFTFGIPMPVQPMKAIAAVAITEGMTQNTIIASGIAAGIAMLILSATGLINFVYRIVPKPVVRGLQLAIGLKLLIKGVEMIAGTGRLLAPDSVITALFCLSIALLSFRYKKIPGALVIFILGAGLLFWARPDVLSRLTLGWELPHLIFPSTSDFLTGFWRSAVPQIPLTVMNSVIAVCALSADFFPERPLSPRKVSMSVAIMNLISCPLGGMPMCHGSGGLAAQYRFGARTGGSVVFLGLGKMLLAVAFGSSLLTIISVYPASVLGVLLAFSGYELAIVCRDQTALSRILIMVLTAGVCIAVNIAVGTIVGFILALFLFKGLPGSQSRRVNSENVTKT
ncbi:MAG: putative sulfate/molybdate transporter [candidate division Zixibacteria bacterium]